MAYDALGKYPDYLKDFDEIKALADWQGLIMTSFLAEANRMLSEIKMTSISAEKWKEIIDTPIEGLYYDDVLKQFHQIHPVVTINELKKILTCWLDEEDFTVEYDTESMMVVIRTKVSSVYMIDCRNRIRDVIPCNMQLEIEYVDSL